MSARPNLRELQKDAGRDRIAEAAAPLFMAKGYATTTVKDVAHAAGVAEATVYNLFGTKAKLLIETWSRIVPDPAEIDEYRSKGEHASTPEAVIGVACDHSDAVVERVGPMLRVVVEAGASDPAVAAHRREVEQRRLEGHTWVLDVLDHNGWLRHDRPRDELAWHIWLTEMPDAFLKASEAGVPPDVFRRWREASLHALLMPDLRQGSSR